MTRRNVKNPDLPERHFLTKKVDINLDEFGTSVLNRIGKHVDGTNIVAIHHHGGGDRVVQILQQLVQPTTFRNRMSNRTIRRLVAGTGYGSLMLGRP